MLMSSAVVLTGIAFVLLSSFPVSCFLSVKQFLKNDKFFNKILSTKLEHFCQFSNQNEYLNVIQMLLQCNQCVRYYEISNIFLVL
jgi:hypothetical protein